jgi:hypothetical protein
MDDAHAVAVTVERIEGLLEAVLINAVEIGSVVECIGTAIAGLDEALRRGRNRLGLSHA